MPFMCPRWDLISNDLSKSVPVMFVDFIKSLFGVVPTSFDYGPRRIPPHLYKINMSEREQRVKRTLLTM